MGYETFGNATKFSPEGSVISFGIKVNPAEVKFMVTDRGIGLRIEDIPKLFTPFPDIEQRPNILGTGLDLTICKSIVEMHSGQIWAESGGLEKGTTFSFTLPRM